MTLVTECCLSGTGTPEDVTAEDPLSGESVGRYTCSRVTMGVYRDRGRKFGPGSRFVSDRNLPPISQLSFLSKFTSYTGWTLDAETEPGEPGEQNPGYGMGQETPRGPNPPRLPCKDEGPTHD